MIFLDGDFGVRAEAGRFFAVFDLTERKRSSAAGVSTVPSGCLGENIQRVLRDPRFGRAVLKRISPVEIR